jgi:hypothetical protein
MATSIMYFIVLMIQSPFQSIVTLFPAMEYPPVGVGIGVGEHSN